MASKLCPNCRKYLEDAFKLYLDNIQFEHVNEIVFITDKQNSPDICFATSGDYEHAKDMLALALISPLFFVSKHEIEGPLQ